MQTTAIREAHCLVGHISISIVRGLRALVGLEPPASWPAIIGAQIRSVADRIDRMPDPLGGSAPVPGPAIRAWAEALHPGWDPEYRERVQAALDHLVASLAAAEFSAIITEEAAGWVAFVGRAPVGEAGEAAKVALWLAPHDPGVQQAALRLREEERAAAQAVLRRWSRL